MKNLNVISAQLGCECGKKGTKGFCRTEKCPIYRDFTKPERIVDFLALGIEDLSMEFKIGLRYE